MLITSPLMQSQTGILKKLSENHFPSEPGNSDHWIVGYSNIPYRLSRAIKAL